MNLEATPFSYYGSYFSITLQPTYLSLNSLHSKSKPHTETMAIQPLVNGKPVDFSWEATYTHIDLTAKSAKLSICFDDEHRLVIEGYGCGLRLDTKPLYNFEYNSLLGTTDQPYCIVNSYKNLTKNLVYPTVGQLKLFQKLNYDASGSKEEAQNISYIEITPDDNGYFLCVIEDIPTNTNIPTTNHLNFNDSKAKAASKFAEFCAKLPRVPTEFKDALMEAAYILWSSTARPEGNFKHYTIFASNKDFPSSYSWDHAFNALGVSLIDHELAWSQMTSILDHQDELGQVPGSVGDSTIRWNFSKPPVQGLFLTKMMQYMPFSRQQKEYLLKRIEKQIKFYLTYKDSNKDGIVEYHHGNDSGQDNSTVFKDQVVVDSPDLTAFLIEAMSFVSKLAAELQQDEKAHYWDEQLQLALKKFCQYFIVNNVPVAKETRTGEVIDSQGLLPFISIVLGKKLPKEILDAMCSVLTGPRYLTEWGVATEALDSLDYEADAYWRGPIWAPSTLLIVEALEDCGLSKEALEISRRFCHLVKHNGFAENFNALTGEGLRDKSFTWTASTFIFLAAKLQQHEASS